jgi:hypothetical protein
MPDICFSTQRLDNYNDQTEPFGKVSNLPAHRTHQTMPQPDRMRYLGQPSMDMAQQAESLPHRLQMSDISISTQRSHSCSAAMARLGIQSAAVAEADLRKSFTKRREGQRQPLGQ